MLFSTNSGLQHPRTAHRPLDKTLSLAIVAESPAFRIPLEGPVQTRDDLTQQTDGHRTAPDLDIADGTLTAADAIQEVLAMIRALV